MRKKPQGGKTQKGTYKSLQYTGVEKQSQAVTKVWKGCSVGADFKPLAKHRTVFMIIAAPNLQKYSVWNLLVLFF